MTKNKAIREITTMNRQLFPSASFSKTLTNYSKTLKPGRITWLFAFTVGNSRWKMGISREGILKHRLYVHLSVDDDEEKLVKGWYRETNFRLTVHHSTPPFMTALPLEKRMVFTHEKRTCRWPYVTSSELQNGYLVNDSIYVHVTLIILRAFPIAKEDNVGEDKFEQFVSRLARYLEGVERGSTKVKVAVAKEEAPHLGSKEMKRARQSLKECLLSPYGPNVLDKLGEALTTLNQGEMSIQQIQRIRYSLKYYMEDYWMVQKANFECKKWRLDKAWKFSCLKKYYLNVIMHMGELDGLIQEGVRLKERIKQLSKRKEDVEELTLELERVEDSKLKGFMKLVISVSYADKWWTAYCSVVQKAAQVEKEKGAAEERLFVSSKSWSSHMKSLLKQFA